MVTESFEIGEGVVFIMEDVDGGRRLLNSLIFSFEYDGKKNSLLVTASRWSFFLALNEIRSLFKLLSLILLLLDDTDLKFTEFASGFAEEDTRIEDAAIGNLVLGKTMRRSLVWSPPVLAR